MNTIKLYNLNLAKYIGNNFNQQFFQFANRFSREGSNFTCRKYAVFKNEHLPSPRLPCNYGSFVLLLS